MSLELTNQPLQYTSIQITLYIELHWRYDGIDSNCTELKRKYHKTTKSSPAYNLEHPHQLLKPSLLQLGCSDSFLKMDTCNFDPVLNTTGDQLGDHDLPAIILRNSDTWKSIRDR